MTARAPEGRAEARCGCTCGCASCDGECGITCLERPRYFCGQLLTDADLTALVDWTSARLRLVRQRDGWGVVCGLAVRCDTRKPSRIEIGEGYAVSCCGGDIVVCEPVVVDLSDACRSPESVCDDPCAPAPQEPEADGDGGDEPSGTPWPCPEGVWVDILLDALDQDAAGRPALATDGCRRVGSCEPSRVRETHHVLTPRSTGDPLQRAEERWLERYRGCVDAVEASALPEPGGNSRTTYGDLRLAVERFALERACEGGCRALRWICAPDAPSDDTRLEEDAVGLVARIRLELLLDCLIGVGRCDCASCKPGTAVPLARVLVTPGGRADCACRVVAVDDAPPYRRSLGHDCPPAGLGRVNLGDLLGQRPQGVCLEVARRGLTAEPGEVPLDAASAYAGLRRLPPPVFDCHTTVATLVVDDECLGPRVVGFAPASRRTQEAAVPAYWSSLMGLEGLVENGVELLARHGITSLDDVVNAADDALRPAVQKKTKAGLAAVRRQARNKLAEDKEA